MCVHRCAQALYMQHTCTLSQTQTDTGNYKYMHKNTRALRLTSAHTKTIITSMNCEFWIPSPFSWLGRLLWKCFERLQGSTEVLQSGAPFFNEHKRQFFTKWWHMMFSADWPEAPRRLFKSIFFWFLLKKSKAKFTLTAFSMIFFKRVMEPTPRVKLRLHQFEQFQSQL